MSARILLEIALRVLGIWFLCTAIMEAGISAWYIFLMVRTPSPPFTVESLVYYVASVAMRLAVAAGLIWWAPALAVRLYPGDEATDDKLMPVRSADVYHTACFVLGAFLLVRGATSAFVTVAQLISTVPQAGPFLNEAGTAVVSTAAGLLLIFGAQRIGQFVASLRHDPNSIPRQQFSLKLLLIITGVVAVVLGLARMISMRGM